jgi:hypothetical protein
MFDDLHPDELDDEPRRAHDPMRPVSDREVPLGPQGMVIAAGIHAWLDGEAPERSVRRADWSHDVDFWNRLKDDLDTRRRMRTPADLNDRIMRAIPRHAPHLATPWWRREFLLTPSTALLVAAALMALTAVATAIGLR